MKKLDGIHFYINIMNFNDVVVDEEQKTGTVNHSIHALDTFFSGVESFGKRHFPSCFAVEKITGSRLHMYILSDIEHAYDVMEQVAGYAAMLAKYLNCEIVKYKNLLNFRIQVGACYGSFYLFDFTAEEVDEETSIGYCANYAAKLQALSNDNAIAISSNIYNVIDINKRDAFTKKESIKIKKYCESCYYEKSLACLEEKADYTSYLQASKEYANKVNLTDMEFRSPQKPIDLTSLSKKDCKKIEGIPVFADVRGFTSQFDKDDVNLEEMADKTREILTTMYTQVKKNNGVHIQFQGDREFALFHNYAGYECSLDAVKAGLKMIDEVQAYGITIGVGESIGTMFAAKIGARGEKDYILVGSTVIEADENEDENAKENQLVISNDIYATLRDVKPKWASIFNKANGYYFTSIGYTNLKNKISQEQLLKSNKRNNYNGAWRK